MISKIELTDLRFYAYHGVLPQETEVGNHFIVNITIIAPLEKAIAGDELADTINYASVYQIIEKEMGIPSRLLEHVAGRILHSIKRTFPRITELIVKVSKLNPPFGGDLYSASVILQEFYPD